MSGWDEGLVYFNDAGLGTGDDDAAAETLVSRQVARLKFKEFLRTYRDENNSQVYRDQCEFAPKLLRVRMEDITLWSEELAASLRQQPGLYLPIFEEAAAAIVGELQQRVQTESAGLDEPDVGPVQVELISGERPSAMRDLTSNHISKLVVVPGIIIAAARPKAKAKSVTVQCKTCRSVLKIPVKPGFSGWTAPRSCAANLMSTAGEGSCGLDPYVMVPEKSEFVDLQTLKLQENPEDVPTGEMPRNMLLSVERQMVQSMVPGTRVRIMAIYSVFNHSASKDVSSTVALRQPYLRVVGIEEVNEGSARSGRAFSAEEEKEFKEFSQRPNILKEVCRQVAPAIFGADDIKRAVACLLFGGVRKRLPDGLRLRGDINVLLLGDPSTAKSQFLKFVEKTAPVAVYTSGKGSSAAGLTASVIRDPSSSEFYLEGGAMVLADGGVVCIDEFDKMRPEDRVAIHEAMEQQTISIAKAGITTVLNSRCSVLAAANPPSGRYDELKTADENIDLQSTILSRFDLIFIVKDEHNPERDMALAKHVIGVHANASTQNEEEDPEKKAQEDFLRRYVEYARTSCQPRLSEQAAERLRDHYVEIRRQARDRRNARESSPIPITVRQLEAVVRLSEALAKMSLSSQATVEHVQEAIRLFRISTLDAAEAGVTEFVNPTPEQRAELQAIEQQIKRLVHIGSHYSEKGLIRELEKRGMAEQGVRRALMVMHQRGEIDYRRERRTVVRKH